MVEDDRRRAHYLAALARLNRGLAHEVRSHLGSVALQLDLIAEILAREAAVDASLVARLGAPAERARGGLQRLQQSVERVLGTTALASDDAPAPDLGNLLRGTAALLATSALDRQVECSVTVPEVAVTVEGRADVLREALAIAMVEWLAAVPSGGRLDARLEVVGAAAVVRFAGGAVGDAADGWIEVVRAAVRPLGGSVRVDAASSLLELTLPLAPEPR